MQGSDAAAVREQRATNMRASNVETDHTAEYAMLQTEAALAALPILIVEEQPAIQRLLCWILQLAGYHPLMCAERSKALTWMDRVPSLGDIPAVVLLDLSLLCTEQAEDFLSSLRAHWQETLGKVPPIIVLTTNPQLYAALEPKEHILRKPFHTRELLTFIRQVTRSVAS